MNINTQIRTFNQINNQNNQNKMTFKGINKKTGEEIIKITQNQVRAKKPNKALGTLIDFIHNPIETMKLRVIHRKAVNNQINDHHYDIAYYLNVEQKTIQDLTKNASMRNLRLLDTIADRYNASKKNSSNVLNSENAINIYKSIPYPKKDHYYIVAKYPGDMENLQRIIDLAGNDSKKLKFVKKLNTDIISIHGYHDNARPELAAELLESKNADNYIQNFDNYKSFLSLHSTDENAVKKLDSLVESGNFNTKKYDIKLAVANIFNKEALHETPILNSKTIEENYTKERGEFLNKFAENIGISQKSLNAGNDKDILHMFKTTNKDNLKIRIKIMDNFVYHKFENYKINDNNEEISAIKELFDKIDNDKHAKSFVNKAINKNMNIKTAKEFNEILSSTSTKKLDIFFNNTKNIFNQTSGLERKQALQEEIKNPFFKTERAILQEQDDIEYGFRKKPNIFSIAGKYIANVFNKTLDKMTSDKVKPIIKNEIKEVEKIESKPTINIIKPIELPKAEEVKPVVDIDLKAAAKVQPEEIVNIISPIDLPKAEEVKPIIEVDSKAIDTMKSIKENIKLVKTAPKQPNAKKLAVINDVNGVIEKKLGTKTLGEQKSDYAKKATKMRLNLLPEIFASIKETRAADRANGTKSKYANKDALALYEKINGKNKKLVNYMLKKRNADGTRKFNIKDIITTLDDAEKQVIQNKKIAPKKYNAQSERNYYNNIFDTNVAIYGQLEKAKKQTVKQK